MAALLKVHAATGSLEAGLPQDRLFRELPMRVAVLKESAAGESRVALSPDAVVRLIRRGIEVVVERGAGEAAFYPDQSYQDAGATVVATDEALKSDLIAAVRCPGTDRIDCELQKEGILTRMDPNQLSQVLGNLCQNAFRYSGAPGTPRSPSCRSATRRRTTRPSKSANFRAVMSIRA